MSAPTTVARALALAAHQLGALDALVRIDGPDAACARELVVAWRHAPPAVAAARVELARPRPVGWRGVHPSWIDHALAGEGAAVRAAVVGDGDGPVERHLARRFLGSLVAIPDGCGPGVAALASLAAAPLTQALVILGRRQLAHALGSSSPREIAALAARLAGGRELVAEVTAVARMGAGADAALGSRRSALARTAGLPWSDPLALARAGLRALAPRCAGHGDLASQLAQRLPRPFGQVVIAELTGAFAATPVDGVGDGEIVAAIARGTVAP